MQKEWEERCAKQEVLQAIRGGQQCSVTTDTAGRNVGTVPTPFTCQVPASPQEGSSALEVRFWLGHSHSPVAVNSVGRILHHSLSSQSVFC